MADPHSLLLPTSADLVRAFIADLGHVFDQAAGAANPTRTILFTSSTTGIQFWRADVDYRVVAITSSSTSIQVLSLDSTATTILTAVDKCTANPGFIIGTNFVGTIPNLNFPLPAQSKLYWAPAASGQFCNVVLQYA